MDKVMEEKLLQIAAKISKAPKAELKKLLQEAIEDAERRGHKDDFQVIKGRLLRNVRYQKWIESGGSPRKRKEPVEFRGFLLGATKLEDTLDIKRRTALKRYRENPDNAILEGYVDEQGTPLDWKATKKKNGEEVDNPGYHKPITGHQYIKKLFGVVMKDGDKEPKFFVMTLWRGDATKTMYKPFVPISFAAMVNNDALFYDLNVARDTQFKTISEKFSYEDWIRKALKDRFTEFKDFEKAVNSCEKATDPWIALEGMVDYIDPTINEKMASRSLVVVDSDGNWDGKVKVYVPKDYELGFREYSEVIVVGKPRKWRKTEDDDYYFSIDAVAVFPIPNKIVKGEIFKPRSAQGETTASEEEGRNLWLD
jgi:hypothetical protein